MPLTLNPDTNAPKLKAVDFNPFAGPKLLKAVPTTPSQVELWLSCVIGGDDANRSYNESVSLDLTGSFSQCALVQALEQVIERHEILRSTFSSDGKNLCIHENFPLELELIDISDLPASEQKIYVENVHQKDAEKTFDLLNGPLFRSYLITLSEERHILKLSAHHIFCDGWSFGILLENISKIYNSIVNKESLLLDQVTPYSTYAKELDEYSATEEFYATEKYWLNQFAGNVPVLDVPTDRPRPTSRTFKSKREDFIVSKELIEKVKQMGAATGASLVSTLIAAFEAYLHLITRQDTIVLGIPAAGQNATGHYELVGHCVNLLPLKSEPKGEQSFAEYLLDRKSQILDAYDHQQFTFGTLMQKLNIARDSSRIPLVPIIFNIDMGMDANVSFSGLTHSLSNDPRNYENFEIFLNITGTEQALTFEWSYNTLLFERPTIQRMMGEFENLLEQIISDPQIKIKDISNQTFKLLNKINTWNKSTQSKYPNNTNFSALINETANRVPTKTAIYFENEALTYIQLNQQSNQFAHYLIDLGIKTGDIIALAVDRSPEMIIALLGIIKSGAAYLPLDPHYPARRIEFMLEDSGAEHLIISEKYKSSFSTRANEITIENIWLSLNESSLHYPDLSIQSNDLAYILYTSGSTGKPKGVQIEHHSLTNFLLSFKKEPGITEDDKLLAITTVSFDISATEFFLPLITGASLLLLDSNTVRDGTELLRIVKEKDISIMQATPTTWQMMLSAGWEEKLPLKVLCGGESLSKDLAERILKRAKELWNVYGPTETTIWSSIKKIVNTSEVISIGRPINNTQIYILDESRQLAPIGSAGEIYIAGDGLARGYLNRPELTSEKFIINPFAKEHSSKMYATGDLGYYLENGELICLGRIDAQVKIRGHRIELEEIEYNLIQQPGIKEAVVTAQGENAENQFLLAHIIPEESNQEEWHSLWNKIYTDGIEKERDLSLEQQDLDIAIITNDEVDGIKHGTEWKNESLKRLKALNAKEILELGAGGGHLLFELAQDASRYIATDYSEVAINKLNEKLNKIPERWKHVRAFAAPADDHSMIDGSFDLVLLHSVVQYFPNLNYFFEVIKKSVYLLNEGGCLFIGDSQTAKAAYMHIAQEQLKYVDNESSIRDFKNVIKFRIKQQNELSIDPDFFYFLPQLIPSITAVDIQLRKGEYLNEGTKSHYDIWIYKGQPAPKAIKSEVIKNWREGLSLGWIEETLSKNKEKVVQINGIQNQRIDRDFAIVEAMRQLKDSARIIELKDYLNNIQRTKSINPTSLWELGDRMGFKTHVRWANDGADGNVEVVFIPNSHASCIPSQPSEVVIKSENDYLEVKKEQVDLIDISGKQIQNWKEGLKTVLPEYMIPVQYIALNRFPTTSNGKIDRKNLPIPERNDTKTDFTAPKNETERAIAEIWSEFLSVKQISIHSNFFESGGHSLTAVRVMLAIEKKFGKKLPISTLFENSTIEKLAKLITGKKKKTKWESLVPIKPTGSKTPVYLVHGGGFNVLTFEPFSKYMDPEQPVYALQGLGFDGSSKSLFSIEDIAKFYISEVLENDPIGPYALGGYCSGGIIAYEMARQLIEAGKKVSLLAMLDSSYYDPDSEMFPGIERIKKAIYFLKSTIKYPRKSYQRTRSKLYKYLSIQQDDVSMYGEEISKNYKLAFKKYRAKPINVKIDLFKATEHFSFIDDAQHYGWKKFALKGINIHIMPGNHNTFITSPNEKKFALTFQNVLNKSQEKSV